VFAKQSLFLVHLVFVFREVVKISFRLRFRSSIPPRVLREGEGTLRIFARFLLPGMAGTAPLSLQCRSVGAYEEA
jgi:hypothetical protein